MAGKIDVNVNQNNNQVILTQNTTNVVEVKTLGPQGQRGATGVIPQGTLSSSAQIANDISGSFTEVSGGFSSRITTLETSGGGGSGIFSPTGSIYSTTNDLHITGSLSITKVLHLDGGDIRSETNRLILSSPNNGIRLKANDSGDKSIELESRITDISASTNIIINTPALIPYETSVVSLGTSVRRYKDLYISGAITASSYTGSFVGDGSGITNVTSTVPQGTLSSSAQISTEISGAFNTPSASFSTRVTTLETSGGGGSGIFSPTGSIYSTTNDLQVTGSLNVSSVIRSSEYQTLGNHNIGLFDDSTNKLRFAFENNTAISLGKSGVNSIELLGTVTASGDISSSASVIGLSGSFDILKVEGSGSNILEVVGSVGDLFTISDSKTGSLFTVTDISSIPHFDIQSNGDILIGSTPKSIYTTSQIISTSNTLTQSLFSINTASYDGAFFDYTCTSASNMRAGSISSIWYSGGSGVVFNETTTADIGDTSAFNILVNISQSKAHLQVHTDGGWKVKTIIRSI